jgi:hypothetical protein
LRIANHRKAICQSTKVSSTKHTKIKSTLANRIVSLAPNIDTYFDSNKRFFG